MGKDECTVSLRYEKQCNLALGKSLFSIDLKKYDDGDKGGLDFLKILAINHWSNFAILEHFGMCQAST